MISFRSNSHKISSFCTKDWEFWSIFLTIYLIFTKIQNYSPHFRFIHLEIQIIHHKIQIHPKFDQIDFRTFDLSSAATAAVSNLPITPYIAFCNNFIFQLFNIRIVPSTHRRKNVNHTQTHNKSKETWVPVACLHVKKRFKFSFLFHSLHWLYKQQ